MGAVSTGMHLAQANRPFHWWWPQDVPPPPPAAQALLRAALSPERPAYDDLRAKRDLLTPELCDTLRGVVRRFEDLLAVPATVEELADWLGPLNRASANPVSAGELVDRASAILEILPDLPAAALTPATRRLVKGQFTPTKDVVEQAVNAALAPWRHLLAILRMLIRLAPEPEDVRRRQREKELPRGPELLRQAHALAGQVGGPGFGMLQRMATVLVEHARREDPRQAPAVQRILQPVLNGSATERGRMEAEPERDGELVRPQVERRLRPLSEVLDPRAQVALSRLPVPGIPNREAGK